MHAPETTPALTPQQLYLLDTLATIQSELDCTVREKKEIITLISPKPRRRLHLLPTFPFLLLS